jgi:hypothetical protein
VEYGDGIRVSRAPIDANVVAIDNSQYLKLEPLPALPKTVQHMNIIAVNGAGWMKEGLVLMITVKDAGAGKFLYYWATFDKAWAVGRTELETSTAKGAYRALKFVHDTEQGDRIALRLARSPGQEDGVTYVHGCPIFEMFHPE